MLQILKILIVLYKNTRLGHYYVGFVITNQSCFTKKKKMITVSQHRWDLELTSSVDNGVIDNKGSAARLLSDVFSHCLVVGEHIQGQGLLSGQWRDR